MTHLTTAEAAKTYLPMLSFLRLRATAPKLDAITMENAALYML